MIYVMSSLVVLRYNNLPINLLYADISGNEDVEALCNLIEGSEGVDNGLEPRRSESSNKSRQYFL